MTELEGIVVTETEPLLRPRPASEIPLAAKRPLITVEDAMSLEQARSLSGRRGARLVLVMGEAGTGKTALTAMLWQQFLEQDGLAGHRIAGSRTDSGCLLVSVRTSSGQRKSFHSSSLQPAS